MGLVKKKAENDNECFDSCGYLLVMHTITCGLLLYTISLLQAKTFFAIAPAGINIKMEGKAGLQIKYLSLIHAVGLLDGGYKESAGYDY